jgi:hypothetical protein
MKKSMLTAAILALFFAGCTNNKSNEHSHDGDAHNHAKGTHVHEDGSVHEDHDSEHHQEEFKVEGDSAAIKKEAEHGHSHDDGSHEH